MKQFIRLTSAEGLAIYARTFDIISISSIEMVRINPDNGKEITDDRTAVGLINGHRLWVRETADEVLQLIEGMKA